MTPITIIKQAKGEGVVVTVTGTGTLKATGNSDVVTRWLPLLREHKPGILAALQEAELTALVHRVADAHGFSVADREEALTIALSDPESALICFRELASRLPGDNHTNQP